MQQQPLVYRRNVVVAVLLVVVGQDRTDHDQQHCYHHVPTYVPPLIVFPRKNMKQELMDGALAG
jgi:hypothetical protein